MLKFIDDKYREQITFRILSRSETSLYFVEDFLYVHNAEDGVFFRSICIIISYAFELALKSRFVFLNKSQTIDDLESKLKYLNHDILKIASAIGCEELAKIGIKDVVERTGSNFLGYMIRTTEGKEIVIENFIDIRYDFLNDGLRNLEKHNTVKMYVNEILKIIRNIKKINKL